MRIRDYKIPETIGYDCCSMVMVCIPTQAIPLLAGLLKPMQWETSYKTNDDYQRGKILYDYLQEQYMKGIDMCTLVEQMERIAIALECLCYTNRYGNNSVYGETSQTQEIYEINQDRIDYNAQTTPNTPIVVDADRCAIAQLTYRAVYEMFTEWAIPAQATALDALLPGFFALLAVWLGAIPLLIPIGIITAVCWGFINLWAEQRLTDVWNTLVSYEEELICAAYNGLYDGVQSAVDAVDAVIDDMPLSPGESVIFKLLYAGWTFSVASTAWENTTEWAMANIQSGVCDACVGDVSRSWTFPPCPGDWTFNYTPDRNECLPDGRLRFGDGAGAYSPTFTLDEPAVGIYGQASYSFNFEADQGGWFILEHWDGANWYNVMGLNQNVLTMVNPDNVADQTITNCGRYPDFQLPAGNYRVVLLDGVFVRTLAESVVIVLGGTLPACTPLPIP